MLQAFFVLIFLCFFQGCTGGVNSQSLLSSYKPCKENCPSNSPEALTGNLSLALDSDTSYLGVDGSDTIELSGTCSDLGRKSNRILVQVYEGEEDTRMPIIDNSLGVNCQDNISTSSLKSVAGVGKTCLVVSQGIGLTDSGNTTSQYPQCFNGRFSFQLRFGRIVRSDALSADKNNETNPKVRYRVKLQLRTTESTIQDSAIVNHLVTRDLYPPPSLAVSADSSNHRCIVEFNPSRFRDIRYSLLTTWVGPTWAASGTFTNSVSGAVYLEMKPAFPPKGDGTTIEKFYHFGEPLSGVVSSGVIISGATIGLMPGMTYQYQLQASDYSWLSTATPTQTDYEDLFGLGNVERGNFSAVKSCVLPSPLMQVTRFPQGSGNRCRFELLGANLRGNYKVEWKVSSAASNWMTTNPTSGNYMKVSGALCTQGSCSLGAGATYTYSTAPASAGVAYSDNISYYVAARQYEDKNNNDQYDVGELSGNWTTSTEASDGSGLVNSCTLPL